MAEVRDISAVALPMTAGIALIHAAGSFSFIVTNPSVSSTASFMAFLLLALLMNPGRRNWPPVLIWTIVSALSLFTGMTIALTGLHTGISSIPTEHFMEKHAGMFLNSLTDTVDGIPFRKEDTGALVKALITGSRHDLGKELTGAFRDSGASHILALSGFHIGIIYGILLRILSFIGNSPSSRKIRSIVIIAACGFYTTATGAGESLVRAFIFILINETGKMTGRRQDLKSTLMASLIIQLALSPSSIISVGFILSYAAMAGIAYIYPRLKRLWPSDGWKPLGWIWNSAAMSIACQVTTGPIAYYVFGTFPQHFLLTNLIALPLTGMIMPAAVCIMILSYLGFCPALLIEATEFLTQCLIGSLKTIALM